MIVPMLADEGNYVSSESTMYRILREEKLDARRSTSKRDNHQPLATHIATAPNQLWSWDITWLLGPVKGLFYKLYMALDIFSRYVVGWEVHNEELATHAEKLIKKTVFKHGTINEPLVLHQDNGGPMKAKTFQSLLRSLNIETSYSRPGVSNDNAYSEALFKTMKYINTYPREGFATIEEARAWVEGFVYLYNNDLLHSGIKYVTPYQRHYGLDIDILANRRAVYEAARERNPERWTGGIRNWDWISEVTLNPINEKKGNEFEQKEKQRRQLS